MIYENIAELIGKTPLMRLAGLQKKYGLGAEVLAKLEYFNPTGSVKDRPALAIIEQLEREGKIKPDTVLLEPTSGNTGIGLAAVCAVKGYALVLTMPETMSVERRKLIAAYGAQIVLTEGAKGMRGAIEKAEELAAETGNSFIPSQFENPANPQAHYETTGPEIYAQTNGAVDIFVAGIGTGGTISGTAHYLKEKKPGVQVVGLEPAASPLLTAGKSGPHGLQGIGANFVPGNYDSKYVDAVMTVTDEEAYRAARLLARTEGILNGITAGAALAAAVRLLQKPENAEKTLVAVLPDSGDRYYSTAIFG